MNESCDEVNGLFLTFFIASLKALTKTIRYMNLPIMMKGMLTEFMVREYLPLFYLQVACKLLGIESARNVTLNVQETFYPILN